MRIQQIHFKAYDWDVDIYYEPEEKDIGSITSEMVKIHASMNNINIAKSIITSEYPNEAFCYSNKSLRKSIMMFARISDDGEFVNSLQHEVIHLASHFDKSDIYTYGEETIATVLGNFAMKVYNFYKNL